ncbi:MAG: acyltransferase [Bernardetiaceae bacterium]|nr:acyltransferase [Bernardetiaceae bacterium]
MYGSDSIKNRRLLSLDLLRALAILMVLGRHHFVHASLYQIGWAGVDLFFVLSGFLVSGLLFSDYKKYDKVRIGRFLVRRALKIYPLFYLFIFLTALLYQLGLYEVNNFYTRLIAECLFVQNYFGGLWNHTWSLAVEEHFYLLLSFVLYFPYLWLRRRYFPFLALSIIFLSITIRLCYAPDAPYTHGLRILPTHLRLDSFFIGALVAYYYYFEAKKMIIFVKRYYFIFVCISLLTFAFLLRYPISSPVIYGVGLSLVALGFAALLLVCLIGNKILIHWSKKLKIHHLIKSLALLGRYSYAIYLVHLPIEWFFFSLQTGRLAFIIYVVTSVLLGSLLSYALEQPILAWRNRYFK